MVKSSKRFNEIVKRENIDGRSVWVARNPKDNSIISSRLAKGSGLNKATAKQLFKRNFTFDPDIKKSFFKLVNFRETTTFSKKPKKLSAPTKGKYQYLVKGIFRKKEIIASSQIVKSGLTTSNSDAIRRARESFWERVSQSAGDTYDADQGKTYNSEVTNYQEGWKEYSAL